MDIGKLGFKLAALESALSSLETVVELRGQTQRLRNILTASDLDRAAVVCVVSIKAITLDLESQFKDGE